MPDSHYSVKWQWVVIKEEIEDALRHAINSDKIDLLNHAEDIHGIVIRGRIQEKLILELEKSINKRYIAK
ncbi:hypothetical protein DPV78_000136 [Talaromyces pinophilus]|nr:hypothetical protein DPV78_000136 [Talaromyces pinophilus]